MVSDIVLVSLITVTGPVVILVVKWFLDRQDKRSAARIVALQKKIEATAAETKEKIEATAIVTKEKIEETAHETKEKLDLMHKEFDGMKDALVKSEKVVSKQEGKDEEKADQAEREKNK